MVKLLFINAIFPEREWECRYPNLGIGYLAGSIRKAFGNEYEMKIVDRDIEKVLEEFKPDIVGIASTTKNFNVAKKCASIVKAKKIPVIVGGVHISTMPNNLNKNMDVGVIGEGEETIVELLKLYKSKNVSVSRLKKIKGICFRDSKGKLIITKPRELIDPLDKIPMPARDLLDIKKHTYMVTSRGCPYRCVFCSTSRFWKKVRAFSAEYVINEIKYLYDNYHVNFISLYDDLFIADISRIEKILTLLKKNNLLGKIKFSCSCRANLITPRAVQLLKEMNVVSVAMGLESGCKDTLRFLKGGYSFCS